MYDFMSTVDYRIVILAGIVMAVLRICLLVFAVKLIWKWIVPELFPGLVTQGKVAGDISYKTAVKVIVGLAILSFLVNPSAFIGPSYNIKHVKDAAPAQAPENKVRPKGVIIPTTKFHDQALIDSLRKTYPDVAESEILVRRAGQDPRDDVFTALEWAEIMGIKVIVIEGSEGSQGIRVEAKVKVMRKSGFHVSFVEFASGKL